MTPATSCADWVAQWQALGAGPQHLAHLLRGWTQGLPLERGKKLMANFLPAALRGAWPEMDALQQSLARLVSQHPAEDSAQRLLVRLHDGLTVESVLLPRGGLCISSQVGCAVGCVFCMTGQEGLIRQLGSAEMVAQVALARRLRSVNKVVFMGMGEPSHNLEAVLEAIQVLGLHGNVAHKNLVFSTVGDPRAFERLPQGRVQPALALSLHTTRAELRQRLLPRAPRLSPQELLDQADAYARATDYPLQVQWTLLHGINDTDEELEALQALMQGRKAMLNLILYNHNEGLAFEPALQRPPLARAIEMARQLNRAGVLTRLRHSAGQEVDGGCGQLRARLAHEASDPAGLQAVAPPRSRRPRPVQAASVAAGPS